MSARSEAWMMRMMSILEYPYEIELSEQRSVNMLVKWLEDRKVREWDIDARPPKEWDDETVSRYLVDLGCPGPWPSADSLMFLVSLAIERQYEDDEAAIVRDSRAWNLKRKNEGLVREEKIKLCGENNDLLDILSTIVSRKRARISAPPASSSSQQEQQQQRSSSSSSRALSEAEYPLGFMSSGCARSDEIARNLRLLYLLDLRELQDSINDILIRAQNDLVARPKTNTALGKVGR